MIVIRRFRFFHFCLCVFALAGHALSASAQSVPADMGFRTSTQPPAPPTELTTSYDGKSKAIILKWRDVASPAVSEFHVFRFDNYNPDKTLGEVAIVVRYSHAAPYYTYSDKAIAAGHVYTYFITCKDRFGLRGQNSKMVPIRLPAKL